MLDAHPQLRRLVADGLLQLDAERYRTTRRWQAAMARAAARLSLSGEMGGDLRLPMALALVEQYGTETPDEQIAQFIDVLLPIEARELNPRAPIPSVSNP
jgi:hypothetical protein